jgi:hypothetical protein
MDGMNSATSSRLRITSMLSRSINSHGFLPFNIRKRTKQQRSRRPMLLHQQRD